MNTTTRNNYRDAEAILLDRHKAYYFNGPWLNNKGEKREPGVEAALIDILLSHDNEGDRVILTGHFPETAKRLRDRLNHIREHTDPYYFREEVEKHRRQHERWDAAGYNYKEHDPLIASLWPEEVDNAPPQFELLNSALASLAHIRTLHPNLRQIPWFEDKDESYINMLAQAGIERIDDKISQKGKDALSLKKDFVLARYYNERECVSDEPYFIESLPLLRETQRDEIARLVSTLLASREDINEIPEKFAHLRSLADEYEKRHASMLREVPSLEQKILEWGAFQQPPSDRFKQSDAFEKFSRIGMFVQPEFLEMVKRIITDRYAEFEKEKWPGVSSSAAHFVPA